MKRYIIFLFFLLTLFFIYTQEIQNKENNENWKVKSENFRKEAIIKDLLTADLNRLKSIALSLGLPEMDTISEYRQAIANYYKINLISPTIKKSSGNKIIIKKAGELEYLKVTEDKEENLHISGRAIIELRKQNDSITSYIEADELYINPKTKEITGIGNIVYKDDKLEYHGTQFYYNYELNKGILFSGKTQLIKGGESGLDGAFFTGEKVLKTGEEESILYNGILTTCEEKNPHYYIKVKRLWVGEKGEWGIANGVVFIGHVPFFYLPIYYHPKELIINPAFGYRARHGWYINTTYYLFGEKEADEELTSITAKALVEKRRKPPGSPFRITREEINRKLEEFYERSEFYKKHPNLKYYPKYDYIDFALNFFSDAYTNLGFYTGAYFYFNAQFPNNPLKLMLLTDFAFSRKIWKDPTYNVYYPYNPADMYVYDSSSTYHNPAKNPFIFRHSQFLQMNLSFLQDKINNFNYNMQLEYASDRFYFLDFYYRRQSFTYLDLLADTVSAFASKQSYSAFKTTTEEETNDYNTIRSYIKFSFSPIPKTSLPTVFNFFGLPIINRLDFNIETNVIMTGTQVSSIPDDGSYNNPKRERYLLSYVSFPGAVSDDGSELATNTLSIAGTLADYQLFLSMPEKYKKYKEEKEKRKKEKKEEDILFREIEEFSKIDNTSDTRQLNIMQLLGFFSKKYSPKTTQEEKGKYKNIVPFHDEDKIKEKKKDKIDFKYDEIIEISKNTSIPSYLKILPFSTTLRYEANERIVNRFIFEPKTDILRSDNSNYLNSEEYDTVQSFFIALFDTNYYIQFSKFLKRFNLRNFIDFKLENPTKIISFNDRGLLEINPTLKIYNRKYFDYEQFYKDYLYYNYPFTGYVYKTMEQEIEKIRKENRAATELTISYSDTIVNNLSFGSYRFLGTGIITNIGVDLFRYNHNKEYNYTKFNELNKKNNYYVDPVFYFNRISYDRITALDTTIKFSYNFFPKESSHYLNTSISSKINWKIPSTTLQELKNELWEEEVVNNSKNKIIYTSEIIEEAKEYLYYRTEESYNLIDKVYGAYYGNFLSKYKYIRKMFENVVFSLSYKFMYNQKEIINTIYDLIFVLDNIGNFSDIKDKKNGERIAYLPNKISMWPNHIFRFSLFNSIFQYNMNITYKKVNNIFYNKNLTAKDYRLDEYNIITMENSHIFIFKLPGNLFELPENLFTTKIKSSHWISAGTSFTFKWDKTLNGIATDTRNNIWADASRYNYFYLDSQIVNFSSVLDILKVNLIFKKYNFTNIGYGLDLERGEINLGYDVTEIPTFLRYFKFSFYPQLIFKFYLRHPQYYENKIIYDFGPEYATYNTMTAKLDMNLTIGQGTKFFTNIKFSIQSENRKMYNYYKAGGIGLFFQDVFDSLDLGNIEKRRNANFKLKKVMVMIEHLLCDWKLDFIYTGEPVKRDNRYTWEGIFEFHVTWQMNTKNQLMKMFNKSKLNAVYNRDENNNSTGEWRQPILSLDPDQE